MVTPLVSIITPTFNREAFLPLVMECVQNQSFQDIEWLILDDSEQPSAEFSKNNWNGLRYVHSPQRLSIGAKRNQLLDLARGNIIVQFDDDDYYGASYISDMLKMLEDADADLVLLSGFFCHHLNGGHFGYYRTQLKSGPAFQFNRGGVQAVKLENFNIPLIHLCYGWSYIFRKQLWTQNRFDEINTFEDRQFAIKAQQTAKVVSYEATHFNASHSVHNLSSSQCFPQFLIPEFVIGSLSPEAQRHNSRLRAVVRKLNQSAG